MIPLYNKLCTEFYIFDKKVASSAEVDFYASFLTDHKGLYLEAMCGAGRLLLPLLVQGFTFEGLDNSRYMLDVCKQFAQEQALHPVLYEQSITDFSLAQQYQAVFIVYGSMQLLSQEHMVQALRRCYEHLMHGGFLILETFIPKYYNEQREYTIINPERSIFYANGSCITRSNKIVGCAGEQKEMSSCIYKKYNKQGILIEREEQTASLHWYTPAQMHEILLSVGFSDVEIIQKQLPLNPDAFIFKAIK